MSAWPATFTISIDLELAWGDKGRSDRLHTHEKEREVIDQFLKLCNEYDIPCTWATVGNLFLKDRNDLKQKNVDLIGRGVTAYSDWINDNNQHLWFGPDIIEKICESKTAHEIGSHTFFHTLVSESNETDFETELKETRRIAKEVFDLDLVSFVYPKNQVAFTDSLKKAGYTNFRGKDIYRFSQSHPLRPALNFIDEFAGLAVMPVTPEKRSDELYQLPGSYFFPKILLGRIEAPMTLRVRKCTGGIKKAMQDGSNVHIWFHPQNLSVNSSNWLNGFENLFRSIAQRREAGEVSVATMKDLSV